MIKQFLIGLAIAATTTTTHMSGNLATKGTFGAWVTQRIELQEGVNTVQISAVANGKNTYIDCKFTEPSGAVYVYNHTQVCAVKIPNLSLPWHMNVFITNENPGPATYDIIVQNSK